MQANKYAKTESNTSINHLPNSFLALSNNFSCIKPKMVASVQRVKGGKHESVAVSKRCFMLSSSEVGLFPVSLTYFVLHPVHRNEHIISMRSRE